jgi:hypothetical protein
MLEFLEIAFTIHWFSGFINGKNRVLWLSEGLGELWWDE